MAKIDKRFIKLGTSTNEVNSREIPANFTPSNYTPTQVGSEGNNQISSHLKGIDDTLGSLGSTTGDIGHTIFSTANNQISAANVTGLSFSNAVVRSAEIIYSITINATSNLYETGILRVLQKSSSWEIARNNIGDDCGLIFTITTAGQVQYTSSDVSGFTSGKMCFRAQVTQI